MKSKLCVRISLLSIFLLFLTFSANSAFAATIHVNTTNDELNSDGDCSLREAVEAANTDTTVDICLAGENEDTIELLAGTYTLTIEGANEDQNQTGDLDIASGNITINGAGSADTIIQAGTGFDNYNSSIDRVLHIKGAGVALTLQSLTIANGFADTGGGVDNGNNSSLIIINSTITSNFASTYGGGIHNFGVLTLTNSVVSSNTTTGDGGGIFTGSGGSNGDTVDLINTMISGNSANNSGGGGIYADEPSGPITLTNSIVFGNSALFGGGILSLNRFSTFNVVNTTIAANSASDGGGIYNLENGNIIFSNSSITSNQATRGGGIFNNQASFSSIFNSTISNNSAVQEGGGIYQGAGSVVSLVYSTLSENIADSGGGIFAEEALFMVTASVITNNEGANCAVDEVIDGGNNLQFGGTIADSCGATIPTADPKLGPLADNGGLTLTHALLAGSAAIDAGDSLYCPTTDQRGVMRPQGTQCDIGAYEYELTPEEAVEVLIDLVETFNLQQGVANNLDAKLDVAFNALSDVSANNDQAATNSLQAFINSVEAQRGNKITNAQADILIAAAQAIIASL